MMMDREPSILVQNKLTEAEKFIRRAPEVDRKMLCKSFLAKISNPTEHCFSSSNLATADSFRKLDDLYHKLCETDQEDFLELFCELAKQFGA